MSNARSAPVRSAGPSELHVMCVHLGLREAHRRHQLARLCETVHREVPADAPLVVAGDFNDWRSRAVVAQGSLGVDDSTRTSERQINQGPVVGARAQCATFCGAN